MEKKFLLKSYLKFMRAKIDFYIPLNEPNSEGRRATREDVELAFSHLDEHPMETTGDNGATVILNDPHPDIQYCEKLDCMHIICHGDLVERTDIFGGTRDEGMDPIRK